MDISKTDTGVLNALINVKIEKTDYTEKVEKATRELIKKVSIKGFRPGKVPIGLVKKMYGKSILIEEVNKILSEKLWNYIIENKINILGEPLPSSNNLDKVDLDNDPVFEFSFEIGISPEINVVIDDKDNIFNYNVTVDDKTIEEYKNYYLRNNGSLINTELSEEKSMLYGKMVQLNDDNSETENGIIYNEAEFLDSIIKDDEIKQKFINIKVGDAVSFDIKKAFPNDSELASLLNVKKEDLNLTSSNFKFTVSAIKIFKDAENNQELWDKIYGKDIVTSEEQFNEKIKEEITIHNNEDSKYKLKNDIKNKLIEKATFELPKEFIKKWLKQTNKKEITDEILEKEYPSFEKAYKWQLVLNKYVKDNNITVIDEEIRDLGRKIAVSQFIQYGMKDVPEQYINEMADRILKNEKDKIRYKEVLLEDKVIDFIKETLKTEPKNITKEEFVKL
ncbi:MAG: trigger factor [Bacteroidetes bacterium GWA2_32_17]|nr:MAG: trigger factor [Bacteroidetes bacterium GWA2_32_17]